MLTADGGANWQSVSLSTTDTLRAVTILASGIAYVVSDEGSVFRSEDSGQRWSRIEAPTARWTSVTRAYHGAVALLTARDGASDAILAAPVPAASSADAWNASTWVPDTSPRLPSGRVAASPGMSPSRSRRVLAYCPGVSRSSGAGLGSAGPAVQANGDPGLATAGSGFPFAGTGADIPSAGGLPLEGC